MPAAVFKSVREVSSEDTVHSADNLLNQECGKTWKTKSVGEKSAYVILELSDPQQITGIDIGNEHSAFVEVLVGKAGSAPEDFTEILITCSFMTPNESKTSSIPNRVRCFNQDALVPTAITTKWKFVKIICTQPFNRHVQYGLSFIKLHVVEKEITPTNNANPLSKTLCAGSSKTISANPLIRSDKKQLGKFSLREDSPDSESENSLSLFSRWKARSGDIAAPSTAAAIRQASSPAGLRRLSDTVAKSKLQVKNASVHTVTTNRQEKRDSAPLLDRNRERLLFGDDDDAEEGSKNKRLAKQIEQERSLLQLEKEKQNKSNNRSEKEKTIPNSSAKKRNDSHEAKRDDQKVELVRKRHSPHDSSKSAKRVKSEKPTQYRPFNQLLRGVVFVISGIQNPDRADLRKKATSMGAIYKSDWTTGCTHLICAYQNTPKYNQVKGKGKIATRSWIEKCYALKKYLPWRRYALANEDLAQPESEDEIQQETLKLTSNEEEVVKTSKSISEDKDECIAMYDLGDDSADGSSQAKRNNCSSGSDTEDEIERVTKKAQLSSNLHKKLEDKSHQSGSSEASTEEEDFLSEKLELNNNSLGFFARMIFYVCSDIGAVEQIKLQQIIERYNGRLTQNFAEAHFAITKKELEEYEAEFFNGTIVNPLWIYECNDMQKFVPTRRYLIET